MITWRRFTLWSVFIVVAAGLTLGACRRRKKINPDPIAPAAVVSANEDEDEGTAVARSRPGPPPSAGITPSDAAKKRLITILPPNVEPYRASEPAHGFAIPDQMKEVERSSNTAVFETTTSLAALERFFRREIGRDGTIETQGAGFKVVSHAMPGFVLVTPTISGDRVRIAIIKPGGTAGTAARNQ